MGAGISINRGEKLMTKKEVIVFRNKEYTLKQFLSVVEKGLEPVRTMTEMDGDMYLSDYRNLVDFYWSIHHSSVCLKQGKK